MRPFRWVRDYYDRHQVQIGTLLVLVAVGLGFNHLATQQDNTLTTVDRTLIAINQDIDDGDDRRALLIEVQEAIARLEEIGQLQRCQFGIVALVALDARLETLQNLPPEPCGLTPEEVDDLIALVLGAAPETTTTTAP